MRRPNAQTQVEILPPHDTAAEMASLGCLFVAPENAATLLDDLLKRYGADNPYYELPHKLIFAALRDMRAEGTGIDLVTLQTKLRDRGHMETVGGHAYLGSLSDAALPGLLDEYIETVWEKFLAREALRAGAEISETITRENGISEPMLARVKRLGEDLEQKARRTNITPRYLVRASDFQDEFWAQFYGGKQEIPGWELPIPFPVKIRRKETSLIFGDDGSGKSTLMNFFALHIASQLDPGEKVFIASMETPVEVTLWMLASQLMGTKRLPDTQDGHAKLVMALGWLNEKFLFYNFTGIANWRDILDTMDYAATHQGMVLGVLDSAMRMGIADDDYALQGLVAAAIAQFNKDHKTHTAIIIHENKGDGQGKAKVRGSKLWTANMDNVMQVKLNHDKGEKLTKAEWELEIARQANSADVRKCEEEVTRVHKWYDTELFLRKQRYPGTQQNGSKRFWFDRENFQFRAKYEDTAVNSLERWRRKKARLEQ